jgi:hypothetical protein
MYAYAAPPHLRKILADKESEYEATQSEVNTLFYTRLLYILLVRPSALPRLLFTNFGSYAAPRLTSVPVSHRSRSVRGSLSLLCETR